MKKPRLNQRVFIVRDYSITAEHVVMKGTDSFAVEDTFDDMIMECYRQPIRYDEFGEIWFTKLCEAKQCLSLDLCPDQKIAKTEKDYWEVCTRCT